MEKSCNLILVDDHCLFRDALKYILANSKTLKVIAEASNGKEFLDIIDSCDADLVLMDISMPVCDGIDATREAIKKQPKLKIIALSMYGEEAYYYKMLEAGAQGFILKTSGSDELLKAISVVLSGDNYFSNQVLCKIIKGFLKEDKVEKPIPFKEVKLSKRENEVLGLICAGNSNTEIANKLGISRRTIEGHRSSLINKTGAKNSVNLALYAVRNQEKED